MSFGGKDMAKRICFISRENQFPVFVEKVIDFKYYSGFAISQKQKCISEMHKAISEYDNNLKALEISTKSTNPLGVALSAFNLKFYDDTSGKYYHIENIFQSSKMFENGGPYRDLLYVNPRDAKRDERLKTSGNLTAFSFHNQHWPLQPKTLFYDWIYISALKMNKELAEQIVKYNAFTDIEFNHLKSYNCQARSAAIFVSLYKNNQIEDYLQDVSFRENIYGGVMIDNSQTSLFD